MSGRHLWTTPPGAARARLHPRAERGPGAKFARGKMAPADRAVGMGGLRRPVNEGQWPQRPAPRAPACTC
eukprot:5533207-Pyramimonas_sp.AAC.1